MTQWLGEDTRPVIYMSMGSIYQVPETVLNMCRQVNPEICKPLSSLLLS